MDGETLVALCKREPDELITLYGKQVHPFEILQYPEQDQQIQADILLADLYLQARERILEHVFQCPCGKHNIIFDAQMTAVREGKLWDIRCLHRSLRSQI